MNKKAMMIISRLEEEISELRRIVERVKKAWSSAEKSSDELYLDSVALNLHGFYSCIERLFELIARNIDESIPAGENWHQELLRQMVTEIKLVRPAVLSRDTYDRLDEYRGFRHVVRNVYTFNLSLKKLKPLVEDIDCVFSAVSNEIKKFIEYINANAK